MSGGPRHPVNPFRTYCLATTSTNVIGRLLFAAERREADEHATMLGHKLIDAGRLPSHEADWIEHYVEAVSEADKRDQNARRFVHSLFARTLDLKRERANMRA